MKRLAILGASGHGKVVADVALAAGWREVVFFDDAWPGRSANGRWPVVGGSASLLSQLDAFQGIVVAIGHCAVRLQRQQEIREAGGAVATLVHPHACVSPFAQLGTGTVVMAGAVVNVDSVVGPACIINTGASVDHDCALAAGVHVGPGARLAGNVRVGQASWIGIGACVRQGIEIGAGVMVGAGAVVVKHIADGLVVAGNPARELDRAAQRNL